MGDGRIFLKTGRDASFTKDLSNEPNFDRIHLAGQYLEALLCRKRKYMKSKLTAKLKGKQNSIAVV